MARFTTQQRKHLAAAPAAKGMSPRGKPSGSSGRHQAIQRFVKAHGARQS